MKQHPNKSRVDSDFDTLLQTQSAFIEQYKKAVIPNVNCLPVEVLAEYHLIKSGNPKKFTKLS